MTIFVNEGALYWFDAINYNIYEYTSYIYFVNSWIYDTFLEPYHIYKTGAFRRYYLKLRWELLSIKGKNVLSGMGGIRFFYYHQGTRLRGLPIIKFWFFYKNFPYYYYVAESRWSYITDFKLYDNMNWRRNSDIAFSEFLSKLRPRHWKFWSKQLKYSDIDYLWMQRRTFDVYFFEKKSMIRHWFQWDRFYFKEVVGYHRYVNTEYWMILYCCVSDDMFGGKYDAMLYNHLNYYHVSLNYKFFNLFLIIAPHLYGYIIKLFYFPLLFFKLVLIYIMLFYIFNLNYYFYKLYFMVSYVLSISYPKVIQLKLFVKFLNIITSQEIIKKFMETINKNSSNKKHKKRIKTEKERFVEIIQKELKYPDVLFPIFLYYIVYKKTIFHEMLIDICLFCLKAFFYYNKDKEKLKKTAFLYRITIEDELFNLFFVFNVLLLFSLIAVPLALIAYVINLFFLLLKFFYPEKIFNYMFIFVKNNLLLNSRLIQAHFNDSAVVGIEDINNVNIKNIVNRIYSYMNPFRRFNEVLKLYIHGFLHMEEFYKNVLKEVKKTEKTKEHYEEFLEPVEDLELLKVFTFFVPYKEYILPYNFVTKFCGLFFIKTKNKFTNWNHRITSSKIAFFIRLRVKRKASEKRKDYNFYKFLIFLHNYKDLFNNYVLLWKYFLYKWIRPFSFFWYSFYYCYYYLFFILFKLIHFIFKLYYFYKISGFLLYRFHIIKYYKLIKKFLSHYLLFKVIYHVFNILIFLSKKLILLMSLLFKIFLSIESRHFLPFVNMKYFFTYIYFVLIEFNIFFKLFVWVNIRLFHFFTIFFICTVFIDQTTMYYIYDCIEKILFIAVYYVNSMSFFDYNLSKHLYLLADRYYFTFYEKNHVLVNISIYDIDFMEFMNKMYERTKHALFWNNTYLNTAVRVCSDYLDIELNWWIMQYKFIMIKFKFTRLANIVYIYNMSVYWLIVFKHYKFFIFIYFYFFFEWIYYYFFFILLNYIETYQIDACYVTNYLILVKNNVNCFVINFILSVKYKIIDLINNNYENFILLFMDNYSSYKIRWIQGVRIDLFFNWFYFLIKYKLIRFYIFFDIVQYLQYVSFYYYYMISSVFSNFFYILNVFLAILFGNQAGFDVLNVQLRDFMTTISTLISPLYVICDEIIQSFNSGPFFFRYKDDLSWVWPENEKAFEYGFGVNADKMVVNSFYINKSAIYNYIFSLRFNKNYDFHIYMLFMDAFFLFLLIFYLTFLTKTFGFMLKNKYFYTFGPFVSWDRITVKQTSEEKAYAKLTDYEWQIINNIEYATDLRTFKGDVFETDPLYDYVNNKEVCGMLFYDILKTFVWNKKIKQKSYVYKIILLFEDYYFERYTKFSNELRSRYINMSSSVFTPKIQSMFFKDQFFFKPKNYFNKYNNFDEFSPVVCFDYQEWKEMFVVPYLYTYCDDLLFVSKIFDRQNNMLLRYLQKFRTIIEEKRRWNIDPIDFVMFERDFYDGVINKFHKGNKFVGKYDAFTQFLKSRRYLDPVFAPIYDIPTVFTNNGKKESDARLKLYKFQEYCYYLAQLDDKYFNDFFNITLFGNFTYPQVVTTRINFELMDSMFNAFDPAQLIEFVPYLPNRFVSTDETNPYYMHVAIQTYWKETLKFNTKRSTSKVLLYDMAFLPEWKLSSMPVFLCAICILQIGFLFNFDDIMYSHKQPFQLDSTFSMILIFFIKVINFSHFIMSAQYMDMWYLMPDHGPFITIEDLEFVFLGSSPSIWNFFYSTDSITSEEWKWLVSTRMFQLAYGVENDPYLMLKNWLEFEPRELFESTHNFRWRDYADMSGTLEMFVANLNLLLSTLIRLWCHSYSYIRLLFSELTGYPVICLIAYFPCFIFIFIPFVWLSNYVVNFNLLRIDNFHLNYIKYVQKHNEHVNKK